MNPDLNPYTQGSPADAGAPQVPPRPDSTPDPGPNPAANQDPTVAFCQQCGRPLTASTRHQVGSGIFCAPCASVRVAHDARWAPVNGTVSPVPPAKSIQGDPNPILAGFLGLIPGVGAMFNGQYAKAAAHLIVFVLLVTLNNNFNSDALGWLIAGWIFYQAFEAYHTAIARRNGQPLPDLFGWNNLEERIGMQRPAAPVPPANGWPTGTPPGERPVASNAGTATPGVPTSGIPTPGTSDGHAAGSTAYTPVAGSTAYVPRDPTTVDPAPVSYASPGMPGPVAPADSSAHPSTHIPFAATYTGPGAYPGAAPGAGVYTPVTPAFTSHARRFPVGALWLIGLGVLFLLGNILPGFRLRAGWLVPVLLGVLALWVGSNRFAVWKEAAGVSGLATGLDVLSDQLLLPALLLTFALLLGLANASLVNLRHSWPALLIVWGALLLVGRTAGSAVSLARARAASPSDAPTSLFG